MADATTTARDRLERALIALETRVRSLRDTETAGRDADLFARVPDGPDPAMRIAALEAAGRRADAALAEAADLIRDLSAAGDRD